jgi:hypothetical protein
MSGSYPLGTAVPQTSLRFAIARGGKLPAMAGWDDDDWVGEPPEGRYTRDRAKPEFWRNRWPLAGAGLVIVIVVLVIVLVAK